jgi:hypothetical protein
MSKQPNPACSEGQYSTCDLYLAAYLKTAGVPMLSHSREKSANGDKGGKLFFLFDVSVANIGDLRTGYYNDTGKVPAKRYADNIKALKALCYTAE